MSDTVDSSPEAIAATQRRLIEHAQICPIIDGAAREAAALLAQVARERDAARAAHDAAAEQIYDSIPKWEARDLVDAANERAEAAERQLAEARAALAEVKRLVCGDRAPHWQDDYRVTITRAHIADVCDGALLSGETS